MSNEHVVVKNISGTDVSSDLMKRQFSDGVQLKPVIEKNNHRITNCRLFRYLNNGKKQAERCSAGGSDSCRVHFGRLLELSLHQPIFAAAQSDNFVQVVKYGLNEEG